MSNIINRKSHKYALLIIDLFLILLAYNVAFSIRYDQIEARNWQSFLALCPWILIISLFFLSIYELYTLNRKSIWDIVRNIFVALTFSSLLSMSASFLFRQFGLPRSVILIAYIMSIVFLIAWNILFLKLIQRFESGSVLLIGNDQEVEKLMNQIKHPLLKSTDIVCLKANSSRGELKKRIVNVNYVMVCPSLSTEEKAEIIYLTTKSGKVAYVVPSLYDLLLSQSIMTSLDDTMVMAVKPFGLSIDQQFLKRVFDIGVSLTLLIALFPIFIITSIAIKLENRKGNILYSQSRMGKDNQEFLIYKFRSMVEGAEGSTGPVLATQNDSRITKIGRFIRATRIDELPQLVNVLKGEMSIVGPRPERDFFIKQFIKEDESYQYRNTVKPGITGYAQIMGKYTTDVQDKLRFDLYYIRNYSFWLDIIILMRTVIVLLDKTKAEGSITVRVKKNVSYVDTKINVGK